VSRHTGPKVPLRTTEGLPATTLCLGNDPSATRWGERWPPYAGPEARNGSGRLERRSGNGAVLAAVVVEPCRPGTRKSVEVRYFFFLATYVN